MPGGIHLAPTEIRIDSTRVGFYDVQFNFADILRSCFPKLQYGAESTERGTHLDKILDIASAL